MRWWGSAIRRGCRCRRRRHSAAGQFAIGVFLQRNVTGSFIATGAAVLLWLTVDGRFVCRSVARERYRQWASALGLGLLYATLTLLKSRTGWLGGVVCWLMMVTIFASRRYAAPPRAGTLACRTGAGGRRAAGACPAIGLVTQRPA